MSFGETIEFALSQSKQRLVGPETQSAAARWFQAYEAMGEDMRILFFEKMRQSDELKIFEVDHKLADAVGFMMVSYQDSTQNLLLSKRRKAASWFRRFLAFLSYPVLTGLRSTAWKKVANHQVPLRELVFRRKAFLVSLGPTEFCKITNRLDQKKLRLSSFLIKVLDQVMVRFLSQAEQQRESHWYLPVNMRSEMNQKSILENLSSYVSLTVGRESTPESIQNLIGERLRQGHHWGTWYWIQMAHFLSVNRLKKILERLDQKGNRWFGTFSFLGEWPARPHSHSKSLLGFAPPVTRQHPVGVGALVYDGHLLIGVNLHGALGLEDSAVALLREELHLALLSPESLL